MLFYDLQIYKDVVELSKMLNNRIKQMPVYHRRDSGDEMRRTLRNIKLIIYDVNTHNDKEKVEHLSRLQRELTWLKILIDDAIENGALKIDGKKNVVACIKQLSAVTTQATKWKNSVKNNN